MSHSIWELEFLEKLEKLATCHEQTTGVSPLNVSHWDTSTEFRRQVEGLLRLPITPNYLDYIYSYDLEDLTSIQQKLGFTCPRTSLLVTPAGTTAMLLAVHWLRSIGIQRLLVVAPPACTDRIRPPIPIQSGQ